MRDNKADTRQLSRLEIVNKLTDWIKLAALSLLISTLLTAVLGTTAFAIWWWLLR
jgi:hypothetical protein